MKWMCVFISTYFLCLRLDPDGNLARWLTGSYLAFLICLWLQLIMDPKCTTRVLSSHKLFHNQGVKNKLLVFQWCNYRYFKSCATGLSCSLVWNLAATPVWLEWNGVKLVALVQTKMHQILLKWWMVNFIIVFSLVNYFSYLLKQFVVVFSFTHHSMLSGLQETKV